MKEKDNTIKFEQFLKTKHFSLALRFAKNQKSSPQLQAEISRLHGDHLNNKGEYKEAIQHYLQTMNYVDPSYVIHKYMDVSKIQELIQYLEVLHQKRLANHHHTSLLLNSYVKQKNLKKLKDFLDQGDLFTTVQFDTNTAIKVCRELKNTDLALNLAIKSLASTQVLEILLNEKKNFAAALSYLQDLKQLQNKIELLKEFGQIFIKQLTTETVEFIKKLVQLSQYQEELKTQLKGYYNEQIEKPQCQNLLKEFKIDIDKDYKEFLEISFPLPDEYLNLFLVNTPQLENYLKFLINLNNLPNEKVIFNRLFEYYLEEFYDYYLQNLAVWQLRKTTDIELTKREKSIMNLLKNEYYSQRYDKHQLLILFKMYNFDNGITYILDKLNMQLDLQMFYIEKQDDAKIIDICKDHGHLDANLWVQALKYFTSAGKRVDYVSEILENIVNNDALPIQQILSILGKNNKIKFSMVKKYFKAKIQADLKEIEINETAVKSNMNKVFILLNNFIIQAKGSKEEFKTLKTQAKFFTSTRCASCNNQLTMPSFHFLCGHSFDNDCLIQMNNQERECFLCAPEFKSLLAKKQTILNETNDYKEFVEKLDVSCTKVEVLAEYFGRGLINDINKLSNQEHLKK